MRARAHVILIDFFIVVFFYFCTDLVLIFIVLTHRISDQRIYFQCDVGTMYDEPHHSLLNKWLLLTVPDDNQLNAAGYLKICASLIGPGDDAPVRILVFIV